MAQSLVKTQIQQANTVLEKNVNRMEMFLNHTTIETLQDEELGDLSYYKGLLSSLRRLCVYCEDAFETCQVIVNQENFSKPAAERTLYRIFHQCIEEFFSPRADLWYEDSRSAYTGKNSIKFRKKAPSSFQELFLDLEQPFQKLREELEYYETDYATKMAQSK
ncbi:YpuI family protein [Bacillus carboniphilus]|uniref:YpuI family protein n=1 Tax=Bacillus carboniphilus TaxID=86663 RepID=A0ABN0WUR1_9BACI